MASFLVQKIGTQNAYENMHMKIVLKKLPYVNSVRVRNYSAVGNLEKESINAKKYTS